MGYDLAGHLTSTTDGNLHTRTMVVDDAGRVLEMEDALLQKTEFTYDDEGHRLTAKDPANAITSSAYDALGRMTSTTDALGNVETPGVAPLLFHAGQYPCVDRGLNRTAAALRMQPPAQERAVIPELPKS